MGRPSVRTRLGQAAGWHRRRGALGAETADLFLASIATQTGGRSILKNLVVYALLQAAGPSAQLAIVKSGLTTKA